MAMNGNGIGNWKQKQELILSQITEYENVQKLEYQ